MSNHCSNMITFFGDEKKVEKLMKSLGSKDSLFDFNKVSPYPVKYKKLDDECEKIGLDAFRKKYGEKALNGYNSGGFEWRVKNWGTKWNAWDAYQKDCAFFYTTAWGPATPIAAKIHRKNPWVTITHTYEEPGMCFGGFQRYDAYDPKKPKEVIQKPGVPTVDVNYEGEEFHRRHPHYRAEDEASEKEYEMSKKTETVPAKKDKTLSDNFKTKMAEIEAALIEAMVDGKDMDDEVLRLVMTAGFEGDDYDAAMEELGARVSELMPDISSWNSAQVKRFLENNKEIRGTSKMEHAKRVAFSDLLQSLGYVGNYSGYLKDKVTGDTKSTEEVNKLIGALKASPSDTRHAIGASFAEKHFMSAPYKDIAAYGDGRWALETSISYAVNMNLIPDEWHQEIHLVALRKAMGATDYGTSARHESISFAMIGNSPGSPLVVLTFREFHKVFKTWINASIDQINPYSYSVLINKRILPGTLEHIRAQINSQFTIFTRAVSEVLIWNYVTALDKAAK